ncbi:uncharacterized protein LOC119652404 isoform X2 [Hermetia illucens]|nr:uncharacterized protein LOC119652404 isoform X2 [Hermetia illucens]
MTQTVMDDSRYTPGRSVGVQFDQQVESPKKDEPATNFSQSVLLLQKLRNFVIAAKNTLLEDNEPENSISEYPRGLRDVKVKKKFKKFLLPLLIAYKLKFLTLIPVLLGGLLLLAGSTGLAGFFFALFAAVMSLKGDGKY